MTHLSLFSGIGGFDLAAEWAGFETVGQCEFADYPTKVLEKHWPDVPRWRDIRSLTGESFFERTGLRTVDVISGGFPCQPFSQAGKQRGKEDDRYLWPEMLRVIREIRPVWVICENVPGIVNLALDTVLSDLENEGFETQSFIIPACGVDAPHRRDRVFILANAVNRGSVMRWNRQYENVESNGASRSDNAGGKSVLCSGERRENKSGTTGMADGLRTAIHGTDTDADFIGLSRRRTEPVLETTFTNLSCRERETWVRRSVEKFGSQSPWEDWLPEPELDRVVDGLPNRVERLKCLGNAVVPQVVYPFFYYIKEVSDAESKT